MNSFVTFNTRADSTLFETDTLKLHYSVINEGIGTAYVPSLIVSIDSPSGNYLNYQKRVQFPDMEPLDRQNGTLNIIPETILNDDTFLSAMR